MWIILFVAPVGGAAFRESFQCCVGGFAMPSQSDFSFVSLSTSAAMQDWWFVLMVGAAGACFVASLSVIEAMKDVSLERVGAALGRVAVSFVFGISSWLLIDASFVEQPAKSITPPVEFPATIGGSVGVCGVGGFDGRGCGVGDAFWCRFAGCLTGRGCGGDVVESDYPLLFWVYPQVGA